MQKSTEKEFPLWMFILFPALSMMLGWGLRGHIGGGPFGAMIPGAMVVLSLSILLRMPATLTAVVLVFGVFGVGLGGEMTYGQTLGFLRNPDTVWWGTAGTTLKGAVWGLNAGAVLALGFVFRQIPKKKVIIGFLLMMAGMVVGFKLINDPMVLYFSDPENPRHESWAALLTGGLAFLAYFRFVLDRNQFILLRRFAFWGTLGGGLGFGLGGFWMVMGSQMPGTVFTAWWKSMEFTFGLLLGTSLGYAAWISRNEIKSFFSDKSSSSDACVDRGYAELLVALAAGLLIYWLIPQSLEPFVIKNAGDHGFAMALAWEPARIMINYVFYGLVLVLFLMFFPKSGWQLGITLTFSHAAIDLIRDFYPDANMWSPFTMHFLLVFVMTAAVALLTLYFSRQEQKVSKLFLLIIWSCIIISFLRMGVDPEKLKLAGLSFCQAVCGRFVVDIFFLLAAIVVSWMAMNNETQVSRRPIDR